ncbi:MAG: hypothetical protein HYU66_01255 [Armatimonadetes bacterium]|nr:hypothetical protein [Armatimonadota bacterium]
MSTLRVAAAALAFAALFGCARPPRDAAPPAAPQAGSAAVRLISPRLPAGQVIGQSDPNVAAWMRQPGLEHHVLGLVTSGATGASVRPWLYTSTWIPEPVVAVQPDGTFDATIFFDADWDADLVLSFEVENADHAVTSTTDFFVRGSQPLGGKGRR